MEGDQKTDYEYILEIKQKIMDGFYGVDDDFDRDALEMDLDDLLSKL